MTKPVAIDLFCGLGGWTEGLLAAGYDVIGFDNERHVYGEHRYPAQLVLQDVRTIHGSQFRRAALIVASPPCQAYSYRAMPWKRARALPPPDNTLFDACFRIQREAIEAAGRFIPLVVENVRGAEKWVGRARWNFGSFYLWGDVPALMPPTKRAQKVPGFRFDGSGRSFQSASVDGVKNGGRLFPNDAADRRLDLDGRKNPGIELGSIGFNVASAHKFGHMVEGVKMVRSADDKRQHIGVKRKFASAMIAKIPLELARHIGAVYFQPSSGGAGQ
jgi:hypothetical protein